MIGPQRTIGTGQNFKGVRNLVKIGYYSNNAKADLTSLVAEIIQANGRARRVDSAMALPLDPVYRNVKFYWIIYGISDDDKMTFLKRICDTFQAMSDKNQQNASIFPEVVLSTLTDLRQYDMANEWFIQKKNSSRSEMSLWDSEIMSQMISYLQ